MFSFCLSSWKAALAAAGIGVTSGWAVSQGRAHPIDSPPACFTFLGPRAGRFRIAPLSLRKTMQRYVKKEAVM